MFDSANDTSQMLDEAALYEQYTRVISTEPSLNEETEDVCALLKVTSFAVVPLPITASSNSSC